MGYRACEPVCPTGIQDGHLLEQCRDHQWPGGHARLLAVGLAAATQ